MTPSTEQGPMPLAEGFEPRTREDWQALAAGVLAKSRRDETLDGPTAEQALHVTLEGGLDIAPLYLREDLGDRPLGVPGAMPFTRGLGLRDPLVPWDVRQLHDDPDAGRSRTAVLADLEHGVTSVWLHLGEDGIDVADLPIVLADVRLDLAPVVVSSVTDQVGAARALLAHVSDATLAPGGSLGLDPVGAALRLGTDPDLAPLADLVRSAESRGDVGAMTVDARHLHDAGATDVDALAVAVATGVEYLRRLEADGVPVDVAVRHVELRVAAGPDQFLTAALLRAARRVWARVAEACGVPEADRGLRTHAVTSTRMLTRDDPWVNVLRSTLAVFGASVGGADAVTVLPYDTASGLPERFSRRLARNTQILLADESHVGRVTDPGCGSWYLETLTDEVAAAVWARVQEVEAAGGPLTALADGLLHRWVQDARRDRDADLATRRRPLTGVSTYPLLGEEPLERRLRRRLETGERALVPHRDAEPFEALRDRARALGTRASVVVRPADDPKHARARRSALTNLLAVGGLRAVDDGSPVSVDDDVPEGVDVVALLDDLLTRLETHESERAR